MPFPSEEEAHIAYNSLKVDAEPRRSSCNKSLSQTDNILQAEFSAAEAKHLRVSATGFFDLLVLVTQTIEQFSLPLKD